MASASRRILIFGLDSFTGAHLAAHLTDAGYDVCGTVLAPMSSPHQCVVCNITDASSVESAVAHFTPDYVIVLSAITFVPDGNNRGVYDINLFGAINVLEVLSTTDRKPQRVIIPSTSNVYGNSAQGILGENTPPDPISHYAISKFAMEQMARPYRQNLDVVITRPFNYTGVGQARHFVIPKIVDHFRRRAEVIELGNIDVSRDFSDVRDVVEAYRVIMEADRPAPIINLASGEAVSLRQLITWLEELTSHRMEIRVNPDFVRKNEIQMLCGNNQLLRSLGWDRKHTLKNTLEWMLEEQ